MNVKVRNIIAENAASINYTKYFHSIKIPKLFSFLRHFKKRRTLRKLKADAIVYWNNFGDSSWPEVDQKIANKKILYDHGVSWFESDSHQSRLFLSKIDKIICCSYALKRILQLRWNCSKEIQAIHNVIKINPSLNNIDCKTMPKDRKLRFGVSGRLVPIKSINVAIHAIQELKKIGIEAELHIAGEGPLRLQLENLVRKLNLEKQVFFLGWIDDISNYYENIDIFLCPSIHETFGLVCLEAMIHGCPVVCSNIGGLPEVVMNNQTGYCIAPTLPASENKNLGGPSLEKLPSLMYDPTTDRLKEPMIIDPVNLANCMSKIIENPDLYKKMSGASIERSRQNNNFERYIKEINDSFFC